QWRGRAIAPSIHKINHPVVSALMTLGLPITGVGLADEQQDSRLFVLDGAGDFDFPRIAKQAAELTRPHQRPPLGRNQLSELRHRPDSLDAGIEANREGRSAAHDQSEQKNNESHSCWFG